MWQAQTMVRERERRRRGGQSCGIVSGRRMKNPVTVIRVDGELPKEQIREDAKPLEELTFTSALPFLLM